MNYQEEWNIIRKVIDQEINEQEQAIYETHSSYRFGKLHGRLDMLHKIDDLMKEAQQ